MAYGYSLHAKWTCMFVCVAACLSVCSPAVMAQPKPIQLPSVSSLMAVYPGFKHFGGKYRNHNIVSLLGIGDSSNLLLHDTTALRLSYALNKIGNQHSIGSEVIRLSQYGTDSVVGSNGLQYIFHPLAFGPYLADKYGYPTVTKMHLFDPVKTKESFSNKQGIMRVITYKQKDNEPKGHIALWDCNRFYQARDFFYGHTLLSVEFWESPDSDCSHIDTATSLSSAPIIPERPALADDKKDQQDSYIMSAISQSMRRESHRKHRRHN